MSNIIRHVCSERSLHHPHKTRRSGRAPVLKSYVVSTRSEPMRRIFAKSTFQPSVN